MRLHSSRVAHLLLLARVLVLGGCLGGGGSPHQVRFGRLEKWVKTGFQYLQLHLCRRVSSLSEGECKRLSHLQLSGVAVYVSEQGTYLGIRVEFLIS